MLIDPNSRLPILPGTRLLTETFSLVGVEFEDPKVDGKTWRIERLFSPIPGRALVSDGQLVDLELEPLIERHNALAASLLH